MWSTNKDGCEEGDYNTANILNSLNMVGIGILKESINNANQRKTGTVPTLTHDITLRRLGAPIGTIPIMLNTSIQEFPRAAPHVPITVVGSKG